MIRADCDSVRDDLDAFADGELRGDDLRYVALHIDACVRCSEEVDIRRTVGGMIRESASQWQQVQPPAGLASDVVTRVRAESALSWRALINRSVEDWQWVIVGGGATVATCLLMFFCSAVLVLGTSTTTEDGLSTLASNFKTSPGAMYLEVSRQGGPAGQMMIVQLDTSAATSDVLPAVFDREDDERQWVDALARTLQTPGSTSLAGLTEQSRKRAEWLLDNITRMRGVGPAVGPMNTLNVYRLHLVTNTEVTAKGLYP
jgi:anti-sigma factor (TIGR02949 family)